MKNDTWSPVLSGIRVALSDYPFIGSKWKAWWDSLGSRVQKKLLAEVRTESRKAAQQLKIERVARRARLFGPAVMPVSVSRPVGEKRSASGPVEFLLRTDLEGELDTGIRLKKGQNVSFTVEGVCPLSSDLSVNLRGQRKRGSWVGIKRIYLPRAKLSGAPSGTVIVHVGKYDIPIRSWRGVSPASGRLRLSINEEPGQYGDNRGPNGEICVLVVKVKM